MSRYDFSNLPLSTLGLARRSTPFKSSKHDVEDTLQTQRTMNITNPEKESQSIKSVQNLKDQMKDQILTDGPPKRDRVVKKRKRRKKKASKKSSQKRKSWNNGEDQLESKPQRAKVVRDEVSSFKDQTNGEKENKYQPRVDEMEHREKTENENDTMNVPETAEAKYEFPRTAIPIFDEIEKSSIPSEASSELETGSEEKSHSQCRSVSQPITVTIQEENEQSEEMESSRFTQLRRCIRELEGERKRLSKRLREKGRQRRKKMSQKEEGALEKELKKNGVLKRVFDLEPERVQHLITKKGLIKYQSRSAVARQRDESIDATTVSTYSNSKMQSPNTSRWISKFGPQNGLNAWTKVAEPDSPEEKGEDSAKEKKSSKSLKDEIKEYDSQQLMEWIRAYRNERHPLAKTLRDHKLFIERHELTGEELAMWSPRDLADCLKVPPSDIQFKSIVARFQNDEYHRA